MKKINVACIIDDDPIFVRVVKKMMGVAEFCEDVQVYNNGQEAVDGLKKGASSGSPDIIFLDINMPVMNGWGVLDTFGSLGLPDGVHVYVVSSTIDPEEIAKARSYPFVVDFVEKPITVDVFKEILLKETHV